MQKFELIKPVGRRGLEEMSELATQIMKEHYDPIVGSEINDHMLGKFQSVEGIEREIDGGAEYFFATVAGEKAGFVAVEAKDGYLYLSKFYLHKDFRGKGLASAMMDFVKRQAAVKGLKRIRLNVNAANDDSIKIYLRFGFVVTERYQRDVGNGFAVDDYVMEFVADNN